VPLWSKSLARAVLQRRPATPHGRAVAAARHRKLNFVQRIRIIRQRVKVRPYRVHGTWVEFFSGGNSNMANTKGTGQMARAALKHGILIALSVASATLSVAALAETTSGGLEEIVVTAQRRESNLQSTPIAVTAIDANLIEDLSPRTIADIATLVPNFSANKINGFNAASFAMRGVGNTDIIVYNEAPIAVLVDDFVMPSVQSQLLDPFDVQEVSAARSAGHAVRQEHHRRRRRGAHRRRCLTDDRRAKIAPAVSVH
jgi:hypothetical protein